MKLYQKNIVIMHEGIGNQLFQYTFSKYVKSVTKKDTFIHYSKKKRSGFERESILKTIKLPNELPQNLLMSIARRVFNRPGNMFTLIIQYILNIVGFNILKVDQQLEPDVDTTLYYKYPHTTDKQGILILDGYWHSAKMVNLFKDELLEELVNLKIYTERYASIEKEIKHHEETVAIHIRSNWDLGYANSVARKSGTHNQQVLAKNYYEKAIREIISESEDSFFLIFADDNSSKTLKFVEDILPKDQLMLVPSYGDVSSDYSALMLMSKCKNFIMSNSTFGWWGAWLSWAKNESSNQDALYFMPKQWTNMANAQDVSKGMIFSPQCILLEEVDSSG